jgi:hypothetical protein
LLRSAAPRWRRRTWRARSRRCVRCIRTPASTISIWKLETSDAKDDHLIKMSLKDGKVAGFLIQ